MRPAHRRAPARPHLEALETRYAPAAGITRPGSDVFIEGTGGRDTATCWVDNRGTSSTIDDRLMVRLIIPASGPSGALQMTRSFYLRETTGVVFAGFGGDDTFFNGTAVSCWGFGGEGKDTLTGGSGIDFFAGEGGDDRLSGGLGNDMMFGNGDNDLLFGQAGNDTLYGDAGADHLDGGRDGYADDLNGGDGPDTFVSEWVSFGRFVVPIDLASDFNAGQGDRWL
jgi:Ca2+-binding RTX toxin-like protein